MNYSNKLKQKKSTNGIQFKVRLKKKSKQQKGKYNNTTKNIVERTGKVRICKTRNNVGRNIIFFRNKHVVTKQNNVPQ